jgi:SAM-dependent methyltransferase
VTALPKDYQTDPARFAAARESASRWSTVGDVHPMVAERFERERLTPVLDMGCGDGTLRMALPSAWPWIGLDDDEALLRAAGPPGVLAEATQCPLRHESFGAVAALWMLYHLDDPGVAIAEAHRALRPGGLFAASTTTRDDSPEFFEFFGPPDPTSFDAEEAPDIVTGVFGSDRVEVIRWDGPFTVLPDPAAVATFLRGRGISAGRAREVGAAVTTPFTVTKRGALIWARK